MDKQPQQVLVSSENKPQDNSDVEPIVAQSLRVIGDAKLVTGTHRQTVDGSLLGACIVFLATMLTVQKIDTPLTIALVAFAIAIPILVYGFFCAFYQAQPSPGWLVLQAVLVGGWIVESLGSIVVAIGVYCVILHISLLASNAFLWALVSVIIFVPVFSFAGLLIYTMVQYKKQSERDL